MSDKVAIALFWGAAKIAMVLFKTSYGARVYMQDLLDKTIADAKKEAETHE